MAKKAYRELSEAERKHHSLSARVSRYVVIGAAILGVTMLIIGLARGLRHPEGLHEGPRPADAPGPAGEHAVHDEDAQARP